MKKLDDIPKKDIFDVPEGYFEKLPGIIQSRVAAPAQQRSILMRRAWLYAVPMVLLAAAAVWYNAAPTRQQTANAEVLLSEVPTEALVAYLNNANISTEELLESITLDADDAGKIEAEVFRYELDDAAIDVLLEELDTNRL